MRCGAPFCKNTADDGDASAALKGISFHAFPSEVGLRAAWLRALGKQDSLLPDSAVVCSQHFLDDDICETESGLRQLATGAVPSTVQVCMICLNTDSRLFLMSKHKMEEAYEKLTGYPPCDVGNLKQALCIQCAQRLRTFSQFRDKSLRARAIMMDLVEKHVLITRQHIKMINRTKNQLDNNFVVTTLGPDPCDLYIQEHLSEEQQTDSEATLQTVEVKKEGGYDSMSVDEDTAGVNDDSNAEYVNDEFVASNEEYLNETKDPLKYESAHFQCCLCYEQFESEPAYERHMGMHGQAGAGDGERAASPACEARTAASSICPDTSLRAQHGRPVRTARRDPQRADLQQPAVALSSTRLGANNENKVRAEEAGTVQKSEQRLDTYNGEPDKRPLDTSGVTNIHSLANCVVKLYDVLKTPNKFVPLQHESLVIAQKAATAVSMDLNCHVASQSEDIGPVTNKMKVSNPIVSNTSQSEALSNTDTSENNLFSERKWFTCDVCKKTLKRKILLVKHIQTHSEVKPFSCKFCQYKSNYKCALKTHMRTHTGEKPYICKLCDFRFGRKLHLVIHMRTHTGEKPYICKLCDYRCAHKSSLVRHMKLHTGEKPFICKLCDYRCASKTNLVRHMKLHTGEKPFICKLCDYRSAQKCHLVRHMRTHTGEKPYICKLCDYKCSCKSHLVSHMNTHVGVEPF